jgi:hypothetical protein
VRLGEFAIEQCGSGRCDSSDTSCDEGGDKPASEAEGLFFAAECAMDIDRPKLKVTGAARLLQAASLGLMG